MLCHQCMCCFWAGVEVRRMRAKAADIPTSDIGWRAMLGSVVPLGDTVVVFRLVLSLGSDHIVRRQRTPDPLQRELTDRLDLHGVLDLH
jgi:hypothetical protein